MDKLKWYLKQLLPLKYDSYYKVEGKKYLSIWRMWLGRSFNHRAFEINKEVDPKTIFQ